MGREVIASEYVTYSVLYSSTIICNKYVLTSLGFQYPTIFQVSPQYRRFLFTDPRLTQTRFGAWCCQGDKLELSPYSVTVEIEVYVKDETPTT